MPADVTPLIDAYLTHLSVERRLAVNSIESYARDLNQLARFAAGQGNPWKRCSGWISSASSAI
jgi:site-specific recombinase XerD